MTEPLMHQIVKMMKDAQEIHTEGASKKVYVMDKLKQYLDSETYQRYEPLISMTIDFIKYISTNKEILNGLKNNLTCFSCIPK